LAFAQSVKLSVYEEEVDDVISESRAYPEALAATGKIPLTQLQVSRKIGELFSVRSMGTLSAKMCVCYMALPQAGAANPDPTRRL
jgi:uncharacterized Rmd1/YagE family protein